MEAIKMHFTGGLHIGRGAEELDKTATTYGSDALKSALFAVGLAYYPEWENDEKIFFQGFRISSAFPFCGNTCFLPKPAGMKFIFSAQDDLTESKRAKKINYVTSGIFAQWAKDPDAKINADENQIGDGAFLFDKVADAKKFLYTAVQQRVTVPAEGEGDTRPYYFDRMFFSEGSGLYFLIEFTDASLKPKVMHTLRLLADAGIGTDRTVGNGQFTLGTPIPFSAPEGTTKGFKMTLGLYLPSKEELSTIDLEQSNWSLVKRGGYMAASEQDEFRSLRKNSIYFFGESSAFKTSVQLQGKYEDLKPSFNNPDIHSVWRCGMPIFINL